MIKTPVGLGSFYISQKKTTIPSAEKWITIPWYPAQFISYYT